MAIQPTYLDTTHQSSQAPANGPAYRPRLYRILLGMVAVASAGYYSYSAPIYEGRISAVYEDTLPVNVGGFLESHSSEIKQLQNTKEPVSLGQWEYLGGGISKHAYAHPDLPGMVIKVPKGETGYRGYRGTIAEDDLRLHYTTLKQIQSIAAPFDRIVLPESHLYQTSKGPILVEERLGIGSLTYGPENHFDPETEGKEVMDQFFAFKWAAHLCDLGPECNHNAGLITQNDLLKVGIIDVDCVDTLYQIGTILLPAGMVLLAGAAAVAKKTTKTNLRTVAVLGLLGGQGAVLFVLITDKGSQFEPGSVMFATGITLTAIAAGVTTTQLAAAKVYSQVIKATG